MMQPDPFDSEEPVGFFSDPVDEHGNKLATVTWTSMDICGKPMKMVKVPHGEICTLTSEDWEA